MSGPNGPDAELVVVGRVTAPFGVKGWVRISSYTDPAENLMEYAPWFVLRAGAWQELAVEEREMRGRTILVRLRGCGTRDEAAALRGSEIAVRPESLPALAQGEYYWRQLVGCTVIDLSGQRLGTVVRMMATGSNDVMVVRGDERSLDRRERLIPFLEESVIREVDLERSRIRVDWDADF